jgi:hypothetical protein
VTVYGMDYNIIKEKCDLKEECNDLNSKNILICFVNVIVEIMDERRLPVRERPR